MAQGLFSDSCFAMELIIIICLIVTISSVLWTVRERLRKKNSAWLAMAERKTPSVPPTPVSSPTIVVETTIPTIQTGNSGNTINPKISLGSSYRIDSAHATTSVYSGRSATSRPSKRNRIQENTQDKIPLTGMSKLELERYAETRHYSLGVLSPEEDAMRLASLDPDEVIYLNDTQWFHPGACDHYPSKFVIGEELLRTVKGAWVLKNPVVSEGIYEYHLLNSSDAFLFLEANGFGYIAETLAPHNPSNEV